MAAGLSHRQEAFARAYVGLVDGVQRFNATAAATHAGYKDAPNEGWRQRQNAEVLARISDLLSYDVATPNEVLTELRDIAMADWREFVTIRTDPRTGDTLEVKMDLSNKVKSLEILAKAHGLLTDRIDLSGSLTSTVELVGVATEDV